MPQRDAGLASQNPPLDPVSRSASGMGDSEDVKITTRQLIDHVEQIDFRRAETPMLACPAHHWETIGITENCLFRRFNFFDEISHYSSSERRLREMRDLTIVFPAGRWMVKNHGSEWPSKSSLQINLQSMRQAASSLPHVESSCLRRRLPRHGEGLREFRLLPRFAGEKPVPANRRWLRGLSACPSWCHLKIPKSFRKNHRQSRCVRQNIWLSLVAAISSSRVCGRRRGRVWGRG